MANVNILDMQAIKDIVKDIKLPPLLKKSEYCVKITHIIDPHNFYVRLLRFSDFVMYIEKMTPVVKPSSLHINNIILFNLNKETEEPKYARGKIIDVGNNGCNVFALDYGCHKVNIPLDCIWECDGCLIGVEPLAVNCRLANCVPRGKSWGKATDAFKTYVGNESAHMIIEDRTPTQLIVTLDNSCATDIATVLALSDFTTLGYVHNDLNKLTLTPPAPKQLYYKFKQLKLNDILYVRVLNFKSPNDFYVADVNDYREYLKEREKINYYSRNTLTGEKDSMKCGDLVCVWDGYTYERGYIKAVYGDSDDVLVQLVDKGKDEKVHFRNLKIIPSQCVTMPVVAIFCSVKEKLEYNLRLLFQPGNEFTVTVKELGNEFESPNIVSISLSKQELKRVTENKLLY